MPQNAIDGTGNMIFRIMRRNDRADRCSYAIAGRQFVVFQSRSEFRRPNPVSTCLGPWLRRHLPASNWLALWTVFNMHTSQHELPEYCFRCAPYELLAQTTGPPAQHDLLVRRAADILPHEVKPRRRWRIPARISHFAGQSPNPWQRLPGEVSDDFHEHRAFFAPAANSTLVWRMATRAQDQASEGCQVSHSR